MDELNLANLEKDQKLAELQALHDEQRALLGSSAREKSAITAENNHLKMLVLLKCGVRLRCEQNVLFGV